MMFFLQSVQHFAELHTRQTKDLKKEKSANKELCKEVAKLRKEVKNLKLTIDSKVKQVVDDKDSFEKELQSHKDQLASLRKYLDVEMASKKEAERKANEEMQKLKKEHEDALIQAKVEGYEEAISDAADEVSGLKDTIYKAGYELGLDGANLPNDHELYKKVVLCPPGAFVLKQAKTEQEVSAEKQNENEEVTPYQETQASLFSFPCHVTLSFL